MDDTMRIAHFIQRYPPALGGSEAYFARLSRFLVEQGDQVTVFTTNASDLEAFWSAEGRVLPAGVSHDGGVEIRRFGVTRFPGRRYLLKALSYFPSRAVQRLALPCNPVSLPMWRSISETTEPFDVVHASAFPYTWPIVCGQRLARRLGVPFCLTPFLHLGDPADSDDPMRRAYLSKPLVLLLHEADLVFAQTPSERAALLAVGLAPERVQLQGLGVDPGECTGGDRLIAREQWCVDPEVVVVGHLANNSAEKGTVDLLRAAEVLWSKGVRFRVVLAGPEMPNFRRFWANYSRKENVTCLGILTPSSRRNFFAGLDIFALPSRSDSFGLVLLEAWANGLPNVAYRAGGIADVIRSEVDGLLATCGDVDQLSRHLERLISDMALRQRLGQTGNTRVQHAFRWPDKLQIVCQAYRRLVRRGASQGELAWKGARGEAVKPVDNAAPEC